MTIRETAGSVANKTSAPYYSGIEVVAPNRFSLALLPARAMFEATSPTRLTDRLHSAAQRAGDLLPRVTDRSSGPTSDASSVWRRRLALAQGSYYVATGVWPFLHMRSFEAVTGPKTDHWLVQTVGALVGTLGGALLIRGLRAEEPSHDLTSTAATTAVVLALLEGTFVAQRRIAPVYLLDAAAELALAAGWAVTRGRPSTRENESRP